MKRASSLCWYTISAGTRRRYKIKFLIRKYLRWANKQWEGCQRPPQMSSRIKSGKKKTSTGADQGEPSIIGLCLGTWSTLLLTCDISLTKWCTQAARLIPGWVVTCFYLAQAPQGKQNLLSSLDCNQYFLAPVSCYAGKESHYPT